MDEFNFTLGDVVLAEWEDKLFYAKIDRIDWSQSKCVLIFDDDSVEECPFTKIHSGSSFNSNFFIRFLTSEVASPSGEKVSFHGHSRVVC